MNSQSIVFDPAKRQILPPSAAVSCPAFTSDDHSTAAIIREVLDTIESDRQMPPAPPAAEVSCESIILEGHEIRSRYTTSGVIVSQKRSVALVDDAPLTLADPEPPAFERAESVQDAAGEALARLNLRRAKVPGRPVYEPTEVSRWPYALAAAVLIAMLTTAFVVLK
jgi:hypothetical protein